MKSVRFVTVAYGKDHIGLLLTCIYSITNSNPNAEITVIWEEMEIQKINLLKQVFPQVDFVESHFNVGNDFIKRISSKTKFLEFATKRYIDQNICFIDCDTLVIKDINHFFDDEFDIKFTYKDGIFSLNTGVLLSKNTQKTAGIFSLWREKTFQILNDKNAFEIANSSNHPYGGADQMALYNILDYKKGVNTYEVLFSGNQSIFKGVPCSILNETKSKRVSSDVHIIHYKGGWRPILLDGKGFSRHRTKKDSFEMYILYLKNYVKAIKLLKKYDANISYKNFKIKIPFYLDIHTFEESKIKYALFALINKVKLALSLLAKLLIKIVRKFTVKGRKRISLLAP